MLSVEEIKIFCRINEDETDITDNEIMSVYLPAAEAYVKGAVTNKKALTYDNATYKLLILQLINHWYTNRDIVTIGTISSQTPFMFRILMQQLQQS